MKKNFIPEGNPVLNILGYDDPPAVKKTPEEKKVPLSKAEYAFDEVYAGAKKPEPRSKRLNLLIRPSDFEKISKIAARGGVSVNELINRLVESCIKNDEN